MSIELCGLSVQVVVHDRALVSNPVAIHLPHRWPSSRWRYLHGRAEYCAYFGSEERYVYTLTSWGCGLWQRGRNHWRWLKSNFISFNKCWSSLCLLMSWYLTVLVHQQARWSLQNYNRSVRNFFDPINQLENHVITTTIHKSDGKRRNTLGCLDQYACNVLRLWNSRDCETD